MSHRVLLLNPSVDVEIRGISGFLKQCDRHFASRVCAWWDKTIRLRSIFFHAIQIFKAGFEANHGSNRRRTTFQWMPGSHPVPAGNNQVSPPQTGTIRPDGADHRSRHGWYGFCREREGSFHERFHKRLSHNQNPASAIPRSIWIFVRKYPLRPPP